MSPIIAGLGLIVLGLVGAFFGYRIFRVLLPIYGGVAGFLLAWGWWGQNAWLLALIVGVVLAVVFAVLAYAFWSAMVAFGGLIMGGAIGIAIGTSLNLWGWLTALLAIGLGIVFAALFFWIRNEMVIITTSIFGGTLAARGVGELFGWRSGVEGTVNPNPAWLSILVLAVGIVVLVAGLLYQWRTYAKLRWYDSKKGAPPAPALATNTTATRSAVAIETAAGPMGATATGGGAAVASVAAATAVADYATRTDAAAEVTAPAPVEVAAAAVVEEAAPVEEAVAVETAEEVAVPAEVAAAAAVVEEAAPAEEAVAVEAQEDVAEAADAAGDAAAPAAEAIAGAGAVVAAAAVAVDANKVEDVVVEPAADVAALEVDDNKVANVLADLEQQFAGLEESVKFKEALEFVEGIGPVFAEKLGAAGINNVLDLLRNGATRKGRADLAEKCGITGKLILEWVNHADLYRIKGVGSEFADLLEAAGVDTVPELAQRNPVNLLQKMLATNEEKRLVRRAPNPSEVESWVSQAKGLPRIVQY